MASHVVVGVKSLASSNSDFLLVLTVSTTITKSRNPAIKGKVPFNVEGRFVENVENRGGCADFRGMDVSITPKGWLILVVSSAPVGDGD